jgi:4-amino-4-deoxychorismate lyase
MSQLLIETIKCKNGKLYNLNFHQARFDLTRKNYFSSSKKINLNEIINISDKFKSGLFRCRIIYSDKIEKIEFRPHQYREIESLKLVKDDLIDYQFKFSERTKLADLFAKRADCDDILIVKNGCITDSFTANPIFFDGRKWWTPDTPLLPGTQRARLISEGKILVCRITLNELSKYLKVGLINALQDMEEMPIIDIEEVYF